MTIPPIGLAIVAPSGYARAEAAIAHAIARLREHGCTVHNYFDEARVHQRFGDSDAGRLAQLNAAADDPQVQVVMALRGQYGLTRLLPHIDFERMAASGKVFVGFSDFTAFQMGLLARVGASSYAGPMFFSDFAPADWDGYTHGQLWDCLRGPVHVVRGEGAGNPVLQAAGPVWGGNLAMLVSLLGTPWFPQVEQGILFFEDVNEHPYRVERMLLQLAQAGVLERQQAVLLGDFSNYALTAADNGYNFDEMLAYLRRTVRVPILTGLPFGHGRTRATIPVGAHGELDSHVQGFSLTLSAYPTVCGAGHPLAASVFPSGA